MELIIDIDVIATAKFYVRLPEMSVSFKYFYSRYNLRQTDWLCEIIYHPLNIGIKQV